MHHDGHNKTAKAPSRDDETGRVSPLSATVDMYSSAIPLSQAKIVLGNYYWRPVLVFALALDSRHPVGSVSRCVSYARIISS